MQRGKSHRSRELLPNVPEKSLAEINGFVARTRWTAI